MTTQNTKTGLALIPWRRGTPVERIFMALAWLIGAAALALLVIEVIRAVSHPTWDIWASVLSAAVIYPAAVAGMDLALELAGRGSRRVHYAMYIGPVVLAVACYPTPSRPGTSVATWLPLQIVLLMLVVAAWEVTRRSILDQHPAPDDTTP